MDKHWYALEGHGCVSEVHELKFSVLRKTQEGHQRNFFFSFAGSVNND